MTAAPSGFESWGAAFTDAAPSDVDVVIVGAGFSGLMSCVHLLRQLPGLRVAIVERIPRPAPGVAYGACGPAHLLNVPAGRMGAFPDDPGGFFDWLEGQQPGRYRREDFVVRGLFGAYLLATVSDALRTVRGNVALVHDRVDALRIDANGVVATLASGRPIAAKAAILALGLPAAGPQWVDAGGDLPAGYVLDPWSRDWLANVGPSDSLVVVGTGLTALDVLVSLEERGHVGPMLFVSRRGRFPLAHAAPGSSANVAIDVAACRAGARATFTLLRQLAEARLAEGLEWQPVMDALRPHVPALWRGWSAAERSRFLRRLRPLWDIHRHRAPREVLRRVEKGIADGRISVMRGTVEGVRDRATAEPGTLSIDIRTPGGERFERSARWVVNCIGPAMRVGSIRSPLIWSLLAEGSATADPESLGLCADDDGRLLRRDGSANDRVFLVGALRRGDLWESTAVPELRVQAATVAKTLAAAGTLSKAGERP